MSLLNAALFGREAEDFKENQVFVLVMMLSVWFLAKQL